MHAAIEHRFPPCERLSHWASVLQNEVWLRQLMSTHRKLGRAAVAFVAHDSHHPPDMAAFHRLAPHYRATNVTRVFFDEGDVPPGTFDESPAATPLDRSCSPHAP